MSSQRPILQRGRPVGSRTFDPVIASAFGDVMRGARVKLGIAQETLAAAASVERSYLGRVERGESVPSLATIFRIATALGCRADVLIGATEDLIASADLHRD